MIGSPRNVGNNEHSFGRDARPRHDPRLFSRDPWSVFFRQYFVEDSIKQKSGYRSQADGNAPRRRARLDAVAASKASANVIRKVSLATRLALLVAGA
jgi:hypothetical protein